MEYITKDDIQSTLVNMQEFYQELKNVFLKSRMNIEDNLGRRNILMSMVQEEFLARTLDKRYNKVTADGAPGKADIVIEDLDKEIECKLTTITKSGSISLQSDYATLKQKGSLDYIYFIASPDFESFSVIYFDGLTVDDFRSLSPGARGKVAMKKHEGMKKAKILFGNVKNNNESEIEKIDSLFDDEANRHRKNMKRINELKCNLSSRLESKTNTGGREISEKVIRSTEANLKKIFDRQEREVERHRKKISVLMNRKSYWLSHPGKYSFLLEKV